MSATGGGSVERYTTKAGERLWRCRWRDEQRKQRKKSGFKTKRAAEAWMAANLVSRVEGNYVAPESGKITVGALWDSYYAGSSHLRPTTRYHMKVYYDSRVGPHWGEVRVGDIRPSHVRAWIGGLHDSGMAPGTCHFVLNILRSILATAVEDRLVATNAAAAVRPPKIVRRKHRIIDHRQIELLATECARDSEQNRLVIYILGYLGLRAGEAAALRVGSLDLLRRRVVIERSIAKVPGRGQVESPTKTSSTRPVPIPAFMVPLLARQCEGRNRADYLLGDGTTPWNSHSFREGAFNRARARCVEADSNFPADLRLHDLRHSFASNALADGASLSAVSRAMGHASTRVTAEVYIGVYTSDADSLGATLDGARSAQLSDGRACDVPVEGS